MLCELSALGDSFLLTWALLSVLGVASVFFFSGSVFAAYYWRPTFAQWQRKINPAFPTPHMVRLEILQTLKGLVVAAFCPALSLYLIQHRRGHGFCGLSDERGLVWHAGSFMLIWIGSDLYEFAYHWCGHKFRFLWDQHKAHHHFYNPSPFSVIADDAFDQFVRAAPLVLYPMLVPVNMDLLFGVFVLFFYGYGTVLHWGYELDAISAHGKFVNCAYEHYYHHAFAQMGKPVYCGFFFKLWDQLAGSVPGGDQKCVCSRCERAAGRRSLEAWEKTTKYDYSVLLAPRFWWSGVDTATQGAKAT